MDVLLVAPGTNLAHVDAEVQAVVNALHPTVLLGDGATSDALLASLRAGQYDLIWFATHGSAAGILLADGLIEADALTQLLRSQTNAAVFLNTCDSVSVAVRIHNDLSTPIICTISQVDDIDAYHTGALLAGNIASGEALRDAFDESKPGNNSEFLYLNDSMRMTRRDRTDDLLAMSYDTIQRQRRMGEQLEQIVDELPNYQPRLTRGNAVGFAASLVPLWLLAVLSMVQVREAMNLHHEATAIIDFFLVVTFGVLLAYGVGYRAVGGL